jgi:hypothetical protein
MLTTKRHVDTGPVPTVENKKTYEALWWLPGDPENRVPGKAILHPENGIHLILNGTFPAHGPAPEPKADVPAVLGRQYSGARFTLLECREYERKVPFGEGFQRQKFVADRVLSGYHFEHPGEVELEEFYLEATHLKDWMRNVGLSRPEKKENGFFIEYDSSSYSTVPELRAKESAASIVVKSQPQRLGKDPMEGPSGVEIAEWIEVTPDSPTSVQGIISSHVQPLLDFLSLATATPNSLHRLHAKHPDDSEDTPKRRIKVHPTTNYSRFDRSSLFNQRKMLFRAEHTKGQFQTTMNSWFQAYDDLTEVCDLFFGVHYEQGMRDTNRFLNVMQALETYHRLRVDDARINLKKRIAGLVERARPASARLISHTESFAKWAKDSRHFYTHREDRPSRVVARGETLTLLTQSLLWLLRIHFMSEVGFSPTQSEELLGENNRFRVLAEACEEAPWDQSET